MFFLFHSWFHACQFLKRHTMCASQNHFMFPTDVNIHFLVETNLYGNPAQNFLLHDRLVVCSKILTKRLPRGTFTLHYFNSGTDFENSWNTLLSKCFCEGELRLCMQKTNQKLKKKTHSVIGHYREKKWMSDDWVFLIHCVRFVLEKQGGVTKDDCPANSTKRPGGPPGM